MDLDQLCDVAQKPECHDEDISIVHGMYQQRSSLLQRLMLSAQRLEAGGKCTEKNAAVAPDENPGNLTVDSVDVPEESTRYQSATAADGGATTGGPAKCGVSDDGSNSSETNSPGGEGAERGSSDSKQHGTAGDANAMQPSAVVEMLDLLHASMLRERALLLRMLCALESEVRTMPAIE